MPRVKLAEPKRDRLRELFCGVMAVQEKETADVAAMLGCSQPTALRRLREPKTMTIEELLKLSRGFDIPLEEVRQAITY